MSVKNSAAEFLCRVRVLNYKLMCNDILTKCRSVLKIFYRFYIFPYISYTRLLFIVSFFLYLSHDWYIFHQNAKKKKFSSAFTNNKLYTIVSLFWINLRCTQVKTYGQFKSATEAQRVCTDLFETFQLYVEPRGAAFSKTLR